MRYLVLMMVFLSGYSHSCSFVDRPSFNENVGAYENIFVIELHKYRSLTLREKYKVRVIEVVKGSKPVTIDPLIQGRTSCDPNLNDKQKWIVFKNANSDSILLGHCGQHRVLEHIEEWNPKWRQQASP